MSKFQKEAAERAFRTHANGTDTSSLLLIWYDGPLKFAKIGNVGEVLTGKADDTDGETTAAGWSTATLTDAANDSVGELADVINNFSSAGWHAAIQGGLRADDIGDVNDTIDITANTDCHIARTSGVNLYAATAGLDQHFISAGAWDATNKPTGTITELAGYTVKLTAGTATGTAPRLYLCNGIAHENKEILVHAGVDVTTVVQQTVDIDTFTGGNAPIRGDAGDYFMVAWGTNGTSVLTVASAAIFYRQLGASPYANYRANRQ